MAIKVELYGKNLDITDRINEYVTKKVSKLDRFIAPIDEVRIDLGFEKAARSAADRQSAQITIRGKGYILRTEERADDLFTAFDASLEKMQRQIERYKGKHERGRGDGTPASEVAPQPEIAEEAEPTPVIARRKHFHLSPMNEMEAIEQMILLGHDEFFVFYNADTNAINVLYRRRDNTYGLIEPEIG